MGIDLGNFYREQEVVMILKVTENQTKDITMI